MSKAQLEFKVYSHITSYPIIKETADYAVSWSMIKLLAQQLVSSIQTVLSYLSNFELFVKYWNLLDVTIDGWLVFLDDKLPIIKSISFSSIYQSIKTYYDNLIIAVRSKFDDLLKACHAPIHSFMKFIDPVLKVANDYYEYILNLVLPYSKQVESEAHNVTENVKSEYERLLSLGLETYSRIHSTASNVSKLSTHVTNTYKNELKESNSTTQAVSNTTRKLSSDAYQSIKPTLDRVVGATTSAVSSNIVEPTVQINDDLSTAVATGVEVH